VSDSYLQIFSNDIQYGASNINLRPTNLLLHVTLVPANPDLVTAPSISHSFTIKENVGSVLIGPYGPIRSCFMISKYLDLTDPVANAGQDLTAFVGENIEFDGSASYDNTGITSYKWDFGDGNQYILPYDEGQSPYHSYDSPGTYNVTLTVTDAVGNFASDSITVKILDPNPVTNLDIVAIIIATGFVISIVVFAIFLSRKNRKN